MAKNFGLAVEVIGPAEIKARYPLLEVGDAVGGVFLPKDGQANPIDTTQAFAKGARQRGAQDRRGRQGRAHPGRAGQGGGRDDRAGAGRRRRPSCSPPACGRASSAAADRRLGAAARGRAFLHRHRAAGRACRATCRCCGSPTSAPTTRRMPASCWSAPSSRWPSPGAWTASRRSFCFDTPARGHGPFRADPGEGHAHACRSWPRPASRPSSTARRASRPTTATSSARPPRCATCSSPPASTRSASRARAAPARCWRNGSATAACRSTSPTSTCAACTRSRATARYLRDRTTETPGPALRHALALPAVRDRPRRAPLAVPRPAGRGRCGHGRDGGLGAAELVCAAGRRARVSLLLGPAELVRAHRRRMPGGARRRGACSTSRASPSSWSRARTPARC